jgi:hypothetical protein
LHALADALADGSTHATLRAEAAREFDTDFTFFKHLFSDQSEASKQKMLVELKKDGNWDIDAFDLIFRLISKIRNMSQFFWCHFVCFLTCVRSPFFSLLFRCGFCFVV